MQGACYMAHMNGRCTEPTVVRTHFAIVYTGVAPLTCVNQHFRDLGIAPHECAVALVPRKVGQPEIKCVAVCKSVAEARSKECTQ
jgi:hypothetical protein